MQAEDEDPKVVIRNKILESKSFQENHYTHALISSLTIAVII